MDFMFSSTHHWPLLHWRRPSMTASAIGWVAVGVSVIGDSTFSGFVKVLSPALSPLSLLFLSECLTALFVMLTFGLLPTIASLAKLRGKDALWLLALGTCSGIAGPLLWFSGTALTGAVNASFFGKTDTVFMILLASILLQEKISRTHALAMVTIAAGVLTITFEGFTTALRPELGDALILLAAFAYACGNIIFRTYLSHVPPQAALLGRCFTGITMFFLVSPFVTHPFIEEVHAFPLHLLAPLIGFGFISRFLNSFSFYEAIHRLPVTTVSLVGTLSIVGGAVFAYLYIGEAIAWYHVLGGALILAGTVIVELGGPMQRVTTHLPVTANTTA